MAKFWHRGKRETVLTFPAYLERAASLLKKAGASVIISSQTPNNPWETGKFVYGPSRFVTGAESAARAAGVGYVDHGAYMAAAYDKAGYKTVKGFYPKDHTHTSIAGAKVAARAFAEGLKCSNNGLKKEVLKSVGAETCIK
jgi:rhamnogalacturonan acetylesterase